MSALRRAVATVALDPAITRPGYLFACAVGLAWGALWSTGPIRRSHGLVVFTGLPSWAFGRGGSCVGTSYLTGTNVSDSVLDHEAVHKEQWRLYGMWFPFAYTVAGRDPLRNRFEIEAGLEKGGYLRGH
ncbi:MULTISPECIES: Fe-S oxidoreductase [unclassified Rathayibacter]|uniref:Fe-S oxidoreductase n=1 Tax=unclassified Rathayibacter TaxID=2609250 RepID=UPI000CE8C62E|nr:MULTISPECIES: Fe-S oxidoreductase [unclassified Rathayibacter]PPF27731.1 Fe-S oxidoreductase [Rathayibacter sp. AY1F2]PPH41507.1 Fe-S oxidoreductase [Rathayibacter sp. AY1F7]